MLMKYFEGPKDSNYTSLYCVDRHLFWAVIQKNWDFLNFFIYSLNCYW